MTTCSATAASSPRTSPRIGCSAGASRSERSFSAQTAPQALRQSAFQREIGAFYLERKRNPGLEWQIANCVFSNASLPRALLAEFGGFDETFRMREDLELGIRLFRAGVQPLYIGNAIAYQYLEKSSADLIRDAEAFAAADVRLARKHPQAAVKGQLNWLAQEPTWKQFLRRMAAAAPGVADFFLAPLCACGAACIRAAALRNLGVRALQMRRRIHWYHRALELGWRPSEVKTGDGD